ncbi:YdiY family protein [Pseudoxanthomonas sp. UTMC 1351]|uniref:YdiY family protein n=1 Tax=Pseudoxanthomonas sp. UTMC 1351 TaxID=2695853 RepID=UPI0034CF692C
MSRFLPLIATLTAALVTLAPAVRAQDQNGHDEHQNTKQTAPVAQKNFAKTVAATPKRTAPLVVAESLKPNTTVSAPAPRLKGGGELGYAATNGNSNTESLNGRLDVTYSDGIWKHNANLFGLRSRSEYMDDDDGGAQRKTRTTANRYTFGANSGYMMDERGTINTSLRLEEDDFGTYSRQQSLSLSYGNRVIDSDRAQLDLQLGPGYRNAHNALQDRDEAGVIGRGFFDLRYSLTDNTEIVNKLLVESGEYNTFAQNDLGVSVTMNSHLALKAGWQARHNSDVSPDLKKTDTLTTMNVVYKFK